MNKCQHCIHAGQYTTDDVACCSCCDDENDFFEAEDRYTYEDLGPNWY